MVEKIFYIVRKSKNLNEYLQPGSTLKNQKWSSKIHFYEEDPKEFTKNPRYVITKSNDPDFKEVVLSKEEKIGKKSRELSDLLQTIEMVRLEVGF